MKCHPPSRLGTKLTEETKRKISKALKGRKRSEEEKKRMSILQKKTTNNGRFKPKPFDTYFDKGSGCWLWLGGKHKTGYGHYRFNGKIQTAHRVMWLKTFGEIPAGMCVCHKCDNPQCINPDHLFLGAHLDNMLDRDKKGRTNIKPAQVANKLLNLNDVESIRCIWQEKGNKNRGNKKSEGSVTYSDLGKEYGVTRHTIFSIVHNKNWKNG
jgi:hypothetical protein